MEENIRRKLNQYGQEHIIQFWDELTSEEQHILLHQIEGIDFEQLSSLFKMTQEEKIQNQDAISPMEYVDKYKLSEEQRNHFVAIGEETIQKGEYAVVTMAGGQRYKIRS